MKATSGLTRACTRRRSAALRGAGEAYLKRTGSSVHILQVKHEQNESD